MGERELSGQTAVVTGGCRGIGLAVAEALAGAGATVAVLDVDEACALEAVKTLPGSAHQPFACDVADAQGVQDVIKGVEESLGPVGILVNNAGITRDGLLLRMSDDDWDRVLAVNLKGAFNVTRAVARGMMKQRTGSIVNIASVIGLMGNAGQANYAASKAGIIGLTKSVAREFASRGVRCNAVAPGFIVTDMTAKLDEDAVEALKAQIPQARLGSPEDVARLVRFLAGPDAGYITGQVIAVDGGMAM
jgi:3-oxoacyl-[acyl-carrier protein] reductase